jgi:hypothetical protein
VCVHTKNNILVQASKILPTISPCFGGKSISLCCVGDILSGKKRNVRTKHVKWGAKLEDIEDALVLRL